MKSEPMLVRRRRHLAMLASACVTTPVLSSCDEAIEATFELWIESGFMYVVKKFGEEILKRIIVASLDALGNAMFPKAQADEIMPKTQHMASEYGANDILQENGTKIWYQQDGTGLKINSGGVQVKNISDRNIVGALELGVQDVATNRLEYKFQTPGFNVKPYSTINIPLHMQVNFPQPGYKRIILNEVLSNRAEGIRFSSNQPKLLVLPGRVIKL